MEPYTYRPLQPAPNSTRLLQIQPGIAGSEIHCLIFDYTIDEVRAFGPYEALSYVWGNPHERQRIYVRDVEVQSSGLDVMSYLDVTTNLHAALQRLRDATFTRLLWVDAVCIDQKNLQERAMQVQFMVKIYLYASRALVWLGTEADDSTSALATIEEAVASVRRDRTTGDEETIGYSYRDEKVGPPVDYTALKRLLARPWFRRIWVYSMSSAPYERDRLMAVQDPPRSRRCPTTFDHMRSGRDYRNHLCAGVGGDPAFTSKSDHEKRELSLLDMMSWETPTLFPPGVSHNRRLDILPLADLLERFYIHEASEQLDRVFALLGMYYTNGHSVALPRPDYTKSWPTVIQEVVQHVLGSSTKAIVEHTHDQVTITGRGSPIGKVQSVVSHEVANIRSYFSGPIHGQVNCEVHWGQASHLKYLAVGDILWQMEGARSPCLIRLCDNHVVITAISVYVSTFTMLWDSGGLKTHVYGDFVNNLSSRHRRITLVWNMRPPQEASRHAFRVGTQSHDRAHPCNELRILHLARIFDDLNDRDNLMTLFHSGHFEGTSRHAHLLRLTCSHWDSYQWLRWYIETLRWALHVLSSENPWSAEVHDGLFQYWEDEGGLAYDMFEIDSLLSTRSKQMRDSIVHRP